VGTEKVGECSARGEDFVSDLLTQDTSSAFPDASSPSHVHVLEASLSNRKVSVVVGRGRWIATVREFRSVGFSYSRTQG